LFEIGASLTAAREAQGLSLSDAERLTCLREKHLRALEEDRFDALPGPTYARAFLRSYSNALGLQADSFVMEFDERFPEPEEEAPAEPVFKVRRRRRFPLRATLGLSALATVVAAIAWNGTSGGGGLTPIAPPQAAKAAPVHHVLAADKTVVRHFPLVIHAAGGQCWLQVRRGSATGPVLYEGMLEQGKMLSFAPKVWVRLGAPWNVAVHRGTHVVGGLRATKPVNLLA
jgi:hypothetical protein